MSIENPEQHIGKTIKVKRFGKLTKIYLYKVGNGPHFKGAAISPEGKPIILVVPFSEVESILKNQTGD